MSAGRLILLLLALGGFLSGFPPERIWGQTFTPQKVLGRYQQFVWLEEHGLPQNTVQALTRTRDGYLWLGTLAGAARFDGARFTVFSDGNTPEFKGGYITALLEDRQGSLWLGLEGGGLLSHRDGRFRRFTRQDGLPDENVKALFEDRHGALWAGTFHGAARYDHGRFAVFTRREGLPNDSIECFAEDPSGDLWIGTRGGLSHFKDGRFTTYAKKDGLPSEVVRSLSWDRTGRFWVGTESGLARFEDGRFVAYGVGDGLTRQTASVVYHDREGNLWVGTMGGGLFQLPVNSPDGRLLRYTTKEGLPGDRVVAIYQDPEGDMWIGTDGGLSQLKVGRFQVYTAQNGLANDFVWTVYEDAQGMLWAGTTTGATQFKDGRFKTFTRKDGLPDSSVNTLSGDAAGNLWFGTGAGIGRLQDGRTIPWKVEAGLPEKNIRAVFVDRAGSFWIGMLGDGLLQVRDGRFTLFTSREGLADNYVRVLYEDRGGNLWIGCRNGISRFRDGRLTSWTAKDGLPAGSARSFYEDRSGGLWIGTKDGGVVRFKEGKFAAITAKDGLYDSTAYQVLPDSDDDSGSLWMTCDRGIYRVSMKDLNDFADGRGRSVISFAYGLTDGLLTRECNGGIPGGWRGRDGRLWFATARGVAVVDPRNQHRQPPLVAIEQVTVDRVALPAGQSVRLNPGQENLEIQYTGISWNRPRQIRFKYQLIGQDHDWVDAGTRRTAYYPYLPPGDYIFRVTADNGEGVWNPAGQSLRIVVLPPFYRTWWFLTLSALALLGVGAVIFQVRVRQLKRAKAAQEEFSRRLIESQEHERKRIAAELHDSLSQSLVIIKNRAVLSLNSPDDPEHAFEQLEEIADSTTQVISEVKEISYALRPYQLDKLGLQKAIISMIKKVAGANGLPITAEIDEIDGLFSPEGEINLYRILQESVNNIVRHARATGASVTIKRRGQTIDIRIQDNGRGFVVGAPTNYEPGQGGFGLLGLVERARIFGTQPVIQSVPGEGTTITLEIAIPNPHRKR